MIRRAVSAQAPCQRRLRLTLLITAGLAMSGCFATTGHLAAVSTRDITPADLLSSAPARRAVGRSCIHLVVVFPTSMPNFGNAVAAALAESGGSVLTNVRIGYEIIYLPLVYGQACYVVEGDAR